MTVGRKRMVILHVTHRGYEPRRNFGRGGEAKRVPIKTKTTPPHGEKK